MTFGDTAYVAWGQNFESTDGAYWVAVWDEDGPQSEETFSSDREIARRYAGRVAERYGLEAVEVDEFGAVAA